MNKSSGYIVALILGIALGWLAQQVWYLAGKGELTSIVEIENNEQRVRELRAVAEAKPLQVVSLPDDSMQNLNKLLLAQQFDQAAEMLLANNEIVDTHFGLIQLIVEAWEAQDEVLRALDFIYELKLNLHPDYSAQYRQFIDKFLYRIEAKYESSGEIDRLVDLYQNLVSLEADYVPYYLKLSNWQILQGDTLAAETTLISARHDVRYADELASLEAIIQDIERRKELISVPLTAAGDHYLASVTTNDGFDLQLLLDTGATMSVIKTSLASAYWPELMDSAQTLVMNTANGSVQGKKFKLDAITIDPIYLENVEIGVLPLLEFKYDGLLGMNILKRFEFKIDQVNDLLLLRPI